jgi:hypothetical protein
MQRIADPEQGPLLLQILNPNDPNNQRDIDASRLRLESLLLSRGDPLGEALSLRRRLAADPADAPSLRQRLQACLGQLDRMTVALILRTAELFNCGAAQEEPPRIRFAFECSRSWETLTPTADPKVRGCADCAQLVHWEESLAGVERRALSGQCVAVPAALADRTFKSLTRDRVGRPQPRALWAEQIAWPVQRKPDPAR